MSEHDSYCECQPCFDARVADFRRTIAARANPADTIATLRADVSRLQADAERLRTQIGALWMACKWPGEIPDDADDAARDVFTFIECARHDFNVACEAARSAETIASLAMSAGLAEAEMLRHDVEGLVASRNRARAKYDAARKALATERAERAQGSGR